MDRGDLKARWETLEAENLKSAAEISLSGLVKHAFGRQVIAFWRGERLTDPRLNVEVAGVSFETPIMVGAGWDKQGRCLDGLYELGFAGAEVGSVLLHPQPGNPKPRLFYNRRSATGLNRLGFNAIGVEAVRDNLEEQARVGVTGINIGVNKITLAEFADQVPMAHSKVAEILYDYGDYFVINLSSPNTPGLRDQLNAVSLKSNIRAVKEVLRTKGDKPLFVKLTVDMAESDLYEALGVCIDEGVDGVIDTNTTIDNDLKAKYGWDGQPGGLSGNDPDYRQRATDRMKFITRETRDSGLQRIGVGAINNPEHAIERIEAGAQVVQIVTGIRQRKFRTAEDIKVGLLKYLDSNGAKNVDEFIGRAV